MWVALGLLCLVAGGTAAWLEWGPDYLLTLEARKVIHEFQAGPGEDADIVLLEEAIAPFGQAGLDALVHEIYESSDVRLLRVFDGLVVEELLAIQDAIDAMNLLRPHGDPDIRHGALLSLGRINQVKPDEWRRILADPMEDRFVRQLAAHELKMRGRWWDDLEPGDAPAAPRGMRDRRVTYLRARSTLGDFLDEIAWVTAGKATYPVEARDDPLENIYYFHVTLEGIFNDVHWSERYQIFRFDITPEGNVAATRVWK